MYIEVSESVDEKQWNSLVKSVPEGTVYQTTYWADFMKEYLKVEPIYLTVKNEDGDTVGAMLMFKRGHGYGTFFERPFDFITMPLLRKFFPEYTWMYSPIIFDKMHTKETLNFILKEVDKIAKKSFGFSSVNSVIPPYHGDLSMELVDSAFTNAGYTAKPWATFLVDLTQDTEVLWKNLKKTGRKAVKRAEKQGVHVERVKDEEELHDYYMLLKESRDRLGFRTHSFANFSIMWKHLRKNNCMEVFIAKQADKMIAGLGIIHFNGVLSEIAAAQSNYATENKIYGGDMIKWEIIKWGHENGHRIYDLQGFNPNAEDEKEKGIYQFKEKWGGRYVKYYMYYLREKSKKIYRPTSDTKHIHR